MPGNPMGLILYGNVCNHAGQSREVPSYRVLRRERDKRMSEVRKAKEPLPVGRAPVLGLGGLAVLPEQVAEIFQVIRRERPLIHMIPNTVSAAFCADGLAALGARPLMAVAPEEIKETVAQADGCVVNLGQLSQGKLTAAKLALQCAAQENRPLVLDPVGCGASSFRLGAVQELLGLPWKGIVKGNRSEIYSIQQGKLTREGIDSIKNRSLEGQVKQGCTYLVTGEPDCILWEGGSIELPHLCTLRQNVVGSGCLAGAVAGACSSAAQKMGNGPTVGRQEEKIIGNAPVAGRQEEKMPERVHAVGNGTIFAAVSASLGMAFALEQAGKAEGYGTAKSAILDGLCLLSEGCFLEWLSGRLCSF